MREIAVPGTMLSGRGEHYALEVQGDSMIDLGINDGDIVVIREQTAADNGDYRRSFGGLIWKQR